MTSKHTKRALFASILSMVLCMAMLVGSTFAWFTDSVTSAGNIIKSGTLDVEMQWADGTKSLTAADTVWTDASQGAIFNYDQWEPGYTEARHIKISNVGSLALKYEMRITPTGEAGKLADVIDVYYIKGGEQVANRADLTDDKKIGTLADVLKKPYAAKGHISGRDGETISSDVATIALKMQESAGNEYQNLSIGSEFAIQLVATQYTEEQDSFDNQYDAGAAYPILSQQELQTAIANAQPGDTIFVGKLDLSAPLVLDKDITLKGVDGSVLNNAVIQGKSNAAVTIENIDFTGNSYIHNQGMSALTLTGCDVNVNVPENVNNGRAAFISLGSNEHVSIKLDIRNNHIVAESTADRYGAAIFGWPKIANGSVISGNTFGSADSRYTFIAVKLMNFDDGAVVDISDNTVYGTTKNYGFYAFDMYQNTSRANAYTAVFANNTIDIDLANPSNEAIFIDLESNGDANATIQVATGNTFNGQPVTGEHILIENVNAGTVEFIDVDEGDNNDPF